MPQQINNNALNNACEIKWKNARETRFIAIDVTITPSCLRVDNAIIFFISFSSVAAIPAISIVETPMINNSSLKFLILERKG